MIAAAVVRLISRAVFEASQAAGKKLSNSGIAGLLIGLAVEGADDRGGCPRHTQLGHITRRYWLAGDLPAGEHFVRVGVAGEWTYYRHCRTNRRDEYF